MPTIFQNDLHNYSPAPDSLYDNLLALDTPTEPVSDSDAAADDPLLNFDPQTTIFPEPSFDSVDMSFVEQEEEPMEPTSEILDASPFDFTDDGKAQFPQIDASLNPVESALPADGGLESDLPTAENAPAHEPESLELPVVDQKIPNIAQSIDTEAAGEDPIAPVPEAAVEPEFHQVPEVAEMTAIGAEPVQESGEQAGEADNVPETEQHHDQMEVSTEHGWSGEPDRQDVSGKLGDPLSLYLVKFVQDISVSLLLATHFETCP